MLNDMDQTRCPMLLLPIVRLHLEKKKRKKRTPSNFRVSSDESNTWSQRLSLGEISLYKYATLYQYMRQIIVGQQYESNQAAKNTAMDLMQNYCILIRVHLRGPGGGGGGGGGQFFKP